ncbi:MAG TPA: hypothetical protein PKW35_03065 [Nannocystaceae bacterium]|nr:hypothetical protein [Nannocystaceae bacterium]
MMTIRQAFEQFLQSLELTESESAEAIRQHTFLREGLQEQLDVAQNFLSGSYARNTAIRPLNDIDVFLVLVPTATLNRSSTPEEVLEAVRDALEATYPGKAPTIQSRSVNIEFSGTGIAYDVVPAFLDPDDDEVYWIPDCDRPGWIKTNPRIHRELSVTANEAAGKKLKPLVKAVKHANNLHGKSARSFHLEVLAWSILTSAPEDYITGLERLILGLREQILKPCPDPAGLGPDIRPGPEKLQGARAWLDDMAKVTEAREAAANGRLGEAHGIMRELFGDRWPEKGEPRKGGRAGAVAIGGAVDDSRSRFG